MTPTPETIARGLPGDYLDDAEAMAHRVQSALRRGTGCHLTSEMVIALDLIFGDGDWWTSFEREPQP